MLSKLVTTEALHELVKAGSVKVLDATLPPPSEEVFKRVAIPGAAYLGLGSLKEAGDYPNTWPSAETVAKRAAEVGFRTTDEIVVYEQPGKPGACRAWFILQSYGFSNVSVLDGGLARWFSMGKPTEAGGNWEPTEPEALTLSSEIIDTQKIIEAIDNTQLVDARPKDGFLGDCKENIEGCRQGRVKTAKLFNPPLFQNKPDKFKTFKTPEEI